MIINSVQSINFSRQTIPPKRPKRLLAGLAGFGIGCLTGTLVANRRKGLAKQFSVTTERKYQEK